MISNASGTQIVNVSQDGSNNGYVMVNDSSGTTRARLDSSGVSYVRGGNFGVGTNNPSRELHVLGTGEVARFESTNSVSTIRLYSTASNYSEIGNTGDLYFGVNGEKLRIQGSTGNVGIGTDNPSSGKLQVQNGGIAVRGAATPNINFAPVDGGSGNADISFDGDDLKIISNSSGADIRIGAYSKLDHIVVRPNGKIGIGTDNPGALLTVYGSPAELRLQHEGNGSYSRLISDSNNQLNIYTGGGPHLAMTINGSGNVGINTSSVSIAGMSRYLSISARNVTNGGSALELVGARTGSDQTLGVINFVNQTSNVAEIRSKYQGSTTFGSLHFSTSGSERLQIASDGQITQTAASGDTIITPVSYTHLRAHET